MTRKLPVNTEEEAAAAAEVEVEEEEETNFGGFRADVDVTSHFV